MPAESITNFSKRSDLLTTVVASEGDRMQWLGDALDRLQSKVGSSSPSIVTVPSMPRELSLSNSWLSVNPSGRDDENALSQYLAKLHDGLADRKRSNEALRRECYGWHQRHVVLSQAYRNLQLHRSASESQRQQLAAVLSSLERMVQQWKTQMGQLVAVREQQNEGSSPSAAKKAEEREMNVAIGEADQKLSELRKRRATMESKVKSVQDQIHQCVEDVERLQQRYQQLQSKSTTSESQSPPVEDTEAVAAALRKEIESLETTLEAAKRQQARFLNSYTAKFIAATMFPPSDRLPAHMERRIQELRSQNEDVHKISEAMELLKSTIVHFDSDLKKLRSVQRLVEGDLENVFKVSHNELKVVVTMCIPKEEVRRFSRAGHTCEEWPLTQMMLEEKFPAHKLETVNEALQNMVVAWDGMSQEAKARLTTAQDVVVNAHLLFMIACYVSLKRTQKWALKYQQVMDTRLPRAAGGAGYL